MFDKDDDDLFEATPDPGSQPFGGGQEYTEEFGGMMRDINGLAESRGCTAILPGMDELQLDIDSDEEYALLLIQLERLNAYEIQFEYAGQDVKIVEEWKSRSGNRHVVVRMPFTMEPKEQVMWQAILGSDRKRELYNLLRIRKGMPDPITLFKPKT